MDVELDDKDKLIGELQAENIRLRIRVEELLNSNNREVEKRRIERATIELIRETVNIIASRGCNGY